MDRPNVLWLMCDQLRYDSLGCTGNPDVQTPNIDRLRREGVLFENAVSQYPVCTPFRGGLITGQHAHVNGVRVHGDLLAPTDCTVAHAFRAAGYRTSWVGKWHLASVQGPEGWQAGADYWVHPRLRGGFEDWYGFDCSNHYYNTRYCDGDKIYPPLTVKGYQTDGLADISLTYLEQTARGLDQPWFHVLSVEAPHAGTDEKGVYRNCAPPEYEARYPWEGLAVSPNVPEDKRDLTRMKWQGYYGQITNLDDNIGRVLDYLDETGLAENTLVVFFSDHGEMGCSHGLWEKMSVYDESARIPLIMRLPGRLAADSTHAAPFSGIDLFPTSAGFAGVPIPHEVQGVDLSLRCQGLGGPERGEALIQWLGPALHGFADYQFRAIRDGQHTYAVDTRAEMCMLFDNQADPYQMANRFADPAATDLRHGLHQRLENAILRNGEPLPAFVAQARPA